MDDGDWGPWNSHLPSLSSGPQIKRKRRPKLLPVNANQGAPSEVQNKLRWKSPLPAKAIYLMDGFNKKVERPIAGNGKKASRNQTLEVKIVHKVRSKPEASSPLRIRSVLRGKKLKEAIPITQGKPEPETLKSRSSRYLSRAHHKTFSPVSLNLHSEPEYLRTGQKVLAGRFLCPVQESNIKLDSLMNVLESKLTKILHSPAHQHNLSVS